MDQNKKNERPESYPRPTETDNQLQNQPEFIDDQLNDKDGDEGKVSVNRPEEEEEQKNR
jgi:hypothetical protein